MLLKTAEISVRPVSTPLYILFSVSGCGYRNITQSVIIKIWFVFMKFSLNSI